MRIAVIGATGNVGTAVLRRLHRAASDRAAAGNSDPVSIVGIARRRPDDSVPPYRGVEWHTLDVGTEEGSGRLAGALDGVDAVIHLAWAIQPNRNEALLHRTNVLGTENALRAAGEAGVRQFVCASSVGAYSPADKSVRRDESWPTGGITTSHYSRHKAEQERLLDRFELNFPEIPVARLRPGLIFQSGAGSEIGRYFLGPLIPKVFLGRVAPPVVPIPDRLVFQAVHADDVADAYWRVVERRASGAFNIAAEPELTPARVGGLLGARRVLNIPVAVLRAAVGVSWSLGVQRTDAGWVDMAAQAPVMSTDRAAALLGWRAGHSSVEAMASVLAGMRSGRGHSGSPALYPRSGRAPADG
ncbi:NAD-dependent epimerase/dehydratase family protein [Arthrobacter sp. TMN-37]